MLTSDLTEYRLADFGNQLRIIIGRQSSVDIQIIDRYISRQHCVLHAFDQRVHVARHQNASQPTFLNGVAIGTRPWHLWPWQFLQIGEVSLCALGSVPAREPVVLPATDRLEAAIQALAVYGSLKSAARLSGVKRNTLRRRLQATETGQALLDARATVSTPGTGQRKRTRRRTIPTDISTGVPMPIP